MSLILSTTVSSKVSDDDNELWEDCTEEKTDEYRGIYNALANEKNEKD
jgi:hypothetical protein